MHAIPWLFRGPKERYWINVCLLACDNTPSPLQVQSGIYQHYFWSSKMYMCAYVFISNVWQIFVFSLNKNWLSKVTGHVEWQQNNCTSARAETIIRKCMNYWVINLGGHVSNGNENHLYGFSVWRIAYFFHLRDSVNKQIRRAELCFFVD